MRARLFLYGGLSAALLACSSDSSQNGTPGGNDAGSTSSSVGASSGSGSHGAGSSSASGSSANGSSSGSTSNNGGGGSTIGDSGASSTADDGSNGGAMDGAVGTAEAGGSASSSGSSGDASVVRDSGPSPDSAVDAASDAGGTVTCGTTPAAFDVTKIGKIEQVVVAPDGTVYFSPQPFGAVIGRYAPPYTTVERAWKTVPDANAQILGIALDPKSNVIYAGARVTSKVYKIPTDGSPITAVNLPDAQFNGATWGNDGALYYTNESAAASTANVYRLGPSDTAPTKVNTTPLLHGNDLAFGPDGWLYVNQWVSPATVTRLQLQNGAETARELFVTLSVSGTGAGNGDGIAFDGAGNMYALAGALYKVTPAKGISVLPTPGMTPSSGLEFGCGALSCDDLLVATSAGLSKMTLTVAGLNVPWHRH